MPTQVTPRPLEYLYAHVKKNDQRLYDAFKNLDRHVVTNTENINTIINNGGTWFEEVPAGPVDSVNVSFTLSHAPKNGSLELFLNIVQREGVNFVLSGSNITFLVPPKERDINPSEGGYFLARYQY